MRSINPRFTYLLTCHLVPVAVFLRVSTQVQSLADISHVLEHVISSWN